MVRWWRCSESEIEIEIENSNSFIAIAPRQLLLPLLMEFSTLLLSNTAITSAPNAVHSTVVYTYIYIGK